jgi:hypothetical protein
MHWRLCGATAGVMMRMSEQRGICGSIIMDMAVSSIFRTSNRFSGKRY